MLEPCFQPQKIFPLRTLEKNYFEEIIIGHISELVA
jgi:hypothetical protein